MTINEDIHSQLGEIKAGVLYLCKSMDEMKVDFRAHVKNDDERFTPLENDRQQAIGRKALWLLMIGIVSAVSGYFGGGHH